MTLNQAIFNTQKTDYEKTPIILGQPRGLVDVVNKQYPKQNRLYETLRGQDWTEKEFVFELCRLQFKTVDPMISNDMIRNLAWQWETDSVAASTITSIMGPVCTASEVWNGYQRIGDNESIHALTYAAIVSQSFEDPAAIMRRFQSDKDAHERLKTVGHVFADAMYSSYQWGLYRLRPDLHPMTDHDRIRTYDHIFLYIVALLIMERVEFMPSFAKTFAICDMNMFQPIGDAVQRIAQDELEIHVPFGKENIRSMLATADGRDSFKRNRHVIVKMLNEAVAAEDLWIDIVHADGHELETAKVSDLKTFNYFGGTDVASFLDIREDVKFPLVETNNLAYMDNRVNLGSTQASPQEAPPTSYMVNSITLDDQGKKFDFSLF